MSALGWKATYPHLERSRWSGSKRSLFDQTQVGQEACTGGVFQAARDPATTPANYLQRMSVRVGNTIVLIRIRDVVWIQSHGNLLRVHLHNRSYEHRMTMKDLHQRLDPERFLRVHRSAIVNLDHVVDFELPRCGKALVHLSNGLSLPVSKAARLILRRGLLSPSYAGVGADHA